MSILGTDPYVRLLYDLADSRFFQLFDVPEDVTELRAEFFFFIGREREPRQMRDVFDINFSSRQARKSMSRAYSSKSEVGGLVFSFGMAASAARSPGQ